MPRPVSGKQEVYPLNTVPPTSPPHAGAGVFSQDTLNRANAASFESFSLSTLLDSIVNCFISIYNYFFKSSSTPEQIAKIATQQRFVCFHDTKTNSTTAFLGNSYLYPIKIRGLQFKCAEAAFHAVKFYASTTDMKRFQNLDGKAARDLNYQLMESWTIEKCIKWQDTQRIDNMRDVLMAKFNQHPKLKELLLATGDAYLVAHTPVSESDAFWGDHANGTGKNHLGVLLMELREQLGGGKVQPQPPQPEYTDFIKKKCEEYNLPL